MNRAIKEIPKGEAMPERRARDRFDGPARNPLRGITVLDEAGEIFGLEESWSEKPVILAFVRHFG